MVPLVVVEGVVGAFTAAVDQVRSAGWQVLPGWGRGPSGGHRAVVLSGVVATERDASAAMLAAITGAGVVVHGLAPREVLDRFCDDLRRLGRVDHRPVGERVPRFDEFDRALLDSLAAGLSVTAAAARVHVSRRTADRRLADIRARLGVASTAEALLAFRDQPPPVEPAPAAAAGSAGPSRTRPPA